MTLPGLPSSIGVFGGTFDPVHVGHLTMACELKRQLSLDRMFLLPAATPPHREAPKASMKHRVAMLELAIQEFPELELDLRESLRQGPSYTVQTMSELRQDYGSKTDIWLCMGMDAFLGLPTWFEWQDLLRLGNIAAVGRPDYQIPQEGVLLDLLQRCRIDPSNASQVSGAVPSYGKICLCSCSEQAVSSTAIRRAIALAGQAENGLYGLLPSIADYIRRHHLYCE